MANYNAKPPKGKKFEKGQVNNPLGAGAHNPEVKLIKKLTNDEIAELGSIIVSGDVEKLNEVRQSKTASVIQVLMASVLQKAILRGDMAAANALLDRIVGKVKDQVESSGTIKITIEDYVAKKDEK